MPFVKIGSSFELNHLSVLLQMGNSHSIMYVLACSRYWGSVITVPYPISTRIYILVTVPFIISQKPNLISENKLKMSFKI